MRAEDDEATMASFHCIYDQVVTSFLKKEVCNPMVVGSTHNADEKRYG
jgi:hypothetical protein